jgi:hypothetical protein
LVLEGDWVWICWFGSVESNEMYDSEVVCIVVMVFCVSVVCAVCAAGATKKN